MSVGIKLPSSSNPDLQVSGSLHHRLDLLPLNGNDLTLVKPVHNCVCILEVFGWFLSVDISNLHETTASTTSSQRIHFVP